MEDNSVDEAQTIEEEYRTWKKNAPFLYDLAITHVLVWPSLTCQWLPIKETPTGKNYTVHRLILGTHTSNQEPNYLLIAKVRIPTEDALTDVTESSLMPKNGLGEVPLESKIEIETKILHEGEINRALPEDTQNIRPEFILTGPSEEGYGLSWGERRPGYILSGGNDSTVCVWDIGGASQADKTMKPVREFSHHKGSVGDVCWHSFSQDIFGSVGEDKRALLWDLRQKDPIHQCLGHKNELYAIDFNKNDEHTFITGGADKTVCLWDIRNTSRSLYIAENHKDDVVKVEWSPHKSNIFASCSNDRRLNVWDLTKIGQENKSDDAVDGPPELMFVHGGHRSKIPDFSWNRNDPMLFVSVEEENVLHIWNMASIMYAEEEEENGNNDMVPEK